MMKEPYVNKYINPDLLKIRCKQSIESFENGMFGEVVKCPNNLTYTYLKRGGKVLAVAHRDVVKSIANSEICYIKDNDFYAPQLDDRLGIHLILDVLPKYGVDCDILLTEGEEYGQSTAQYFKTDVEYNWVFELDRAGLDSVMYSFHTKEKEDLLKSYNLNVGWGSFTDICHLDHLKIWAVNFAVAYYSQHTLQCRVDMKQLEEKLLPNIIKFIVENQDTKFPHIEDKVIKRQFTNYTVYNNPYTDYWSGKYWDGAYSKAKSNKSIPSSRRWDRMVLRDNRYVCVDCGESCSKCLGDVCDNGKPKNKCKICTIADCTGYKKCHCCDFYYHRDKYLEHIGICFECLKDIFEIDISILNSLYSISTNVTIQVADIINAKVDNKYEELKNSQ